MQKHEIGKAEWTGMFREIGLDDVDMARWHRLFEERHPQAHHAFLAWLNLPPEEIQEIRTRCVQG